MVARRLSHLGAFGLLAASLPGVAASQQVPATASIVGRLVDVESRAPVGRAGIAILGAHHELASDSEGRFVGDHLASGTYVLQARAIGYAGGSWVVHLGDSEPGTTVFQLRHLPYVLATGVE